MDQHGYWCSTVDPERFAAGDKTTHNIVIGAEGSQHALSGVLTGVRGDLRIGLPWQAVSAHAPVDGRWTRLPHHDPVRLLAIVCAPPSTVDAVLARQTPLARLVLGGWIALQVIDPADGQLRRLDPEHGWVHDPTPALPVAVPVNPPMNRVLADRAGSAREWEATPARKAGPVTGSATPYRGRTAALATRHRKRPLIAAPLTALGLRVIVADEVDTDQFGTFIGDRARPGSARDTVEAKARAALSSAALPLGLASEGSFGPHTLGSPSISNSSPSSTTTPAWSSSAAPEAPTSPGRPTR